MGRLIVVENKIYFYGYSMKMLLFLIILLLFGLIEKIMVHGYSLFLCALIFAVLFYHLYEQPVTIYTECKKRWRYYIWDKQCYEE